MHDGYTFAFTSDTPMTVNPWLYKDLPYQPLKDFVPVTSAVRLPGMLAAHPSFAPNTVAELIALAKQKPGSINYASAGVGNFSHLAMELFASAAGVKLQHVPYKGTGAGRAGAAQRRGAGRLQQRADAAAARAGRQAQAARRRRAEAHPAVPEFPAVAETVPGFEMAPWVGIVAPAGVPQPIIDKLTDAMLVVMNDPAIVKQFADQQLTVMTLPKEKFGELIKADTEKWGKVQDVVTSWSNMSIAGVSLRPATERAIP